MDKSGLVNACVILGGFVMVGLGASFSEVSMKISFTLCGVVAILVSIFGIVNGILSSLGVHLPKVSEDENKRKRRFCPKCLTRVKTVIAPDRSGFHYWCPRCKEAVSVPTTSKRLEKLRPPEKRRALAEDEDDCSF
jgi:ribosomal protein S27AE